MPETQGGEGKLALVQGWPAPYFRAMNSTTKLGGAFAQLSGSARGALWMLIAAVFFAGMAFLVRVASKDVHPLEVVFFRNALALVFMLPWLARIGLSGLKTTRFGLHSVRSALGLTAMACWFTAMAYMPLAEATALGFTAPIFSAIGAALLLGEVVRARRWIAIMVGFMGMLIIVRPGSEAISIPALLAISSALFVAASSLCIKSLSRTEAPNTMVLYMALLTTPISLIPAAFVWSWPSLETWGWLIALGICATIGHLSLARAFGAADASAVMPYDYARLPIVALIAFVAFGEIPDLWTWAGAGVIVASTIYISRREATAARERREAEGSTAVATAGETR
jgi:drug/metabolite transporter (DMT)-like permease